MLLVAFKNSDLGVSMQFRTDDSVLNLRRLQANTKVFMTILCDLLYPDNCVLLAHTQEAAQQLFDRFSNASRRFGLTVSLKKTEVVLRPAYRSSAATPVIKSGETVLKALHKCPYLGSVSLLSSDGSNHNDLSARLAKAGRPTAFGRLSKRFWDDLGIRLETKIGLTVYGQLCSQPCYTAVSHGRCTYRLDVILPSLTSSSCDRKIAHTKWEDVVANTDVLDQCQINEIQAFIMGARTGHVIHMEDTRITKLSNDTRSIGSQYKLFKDNLKTTHTACNIPSMELKSLALDR